jgi:hypothetical protein
MRIRLRNHVILLRSHFRSSYISEKRDKPKEKHRYTSSSTHRIIIPRDRSRRIYYKPTKKKTGSDQSEVLLPLSLSLSLSLSLLLYLRSGFEERGTHHRACVEENQERPPFPRDDKAVRGHEDDGDDQEGEEAGDARHEG